MEELEPEDAQKVFSEIGRLGNGLHHLPFCQLRKTEEHRFGALRLWPKKKTFAELTAWEDLKVRPLVSF